MKWTNEEIEYLKNNYGEIETIMISDKLNRSIDSIQIKAGRIGLKFRKESNKDGYKFCIKCKRELKICAEFFVEDLNCKSGFRNVCRECGKDGHFFKDGYIQKKKWTKYDNKIFIDRYEHYTNYELIDKFYKDMTRKKIHDKVYLLKKDGIILKKSEEAKERTELEKSNNISKKLEGIVHSKKHIEKWRNSMENNYRNHPHWVNWDIGKKENMSQETLDKLKKRSSKFMSSINNPSYSIDKTGDKNPNWRGGKTPLYFELRTQIEDWKKDSMNKCNYKCLITGDEFDEIHHLYPFKNIVDESFEELNLEIKQSVLDYTKEEFVMIVFKIIEIHNRYPFGICLKKDIHIEFHKLYGYKNNTPEQFYAFAMDKYNIKIEENMKN